MNIMKNDPSYDRNLYFGSEDWSRNFYKIKELQNFKTAKSRSRLPKKVGHHRKWVKR